MNRKRLVTGLVICAVGIILTRGNELILGSDSPYLLVLTVVGAVLGLGGLVVVASGLTKTYEKVKPCPNCFTLNPADVETCLRCKRDLRQADAEKEE